jgi:hypothetical protein
MACSHRQWRAWQRQRTPQCEESKSPKSAALSPRAVVLQGKLGCQDTNRNHCELADAPFPWKHHQAMSKVFVNGNPQGPAPAPSNGAAKSTGQVLIVLFGLAMMAGLCLLLYHYWKFAVPFALAAALFACGLSRAVTIGFMFVAVVVLAIIGNAARAQTVVDGDTIKLDGTRWRLWGIDAPETHQSCADGWPAGLE